MTLWKRTCILFVLSGLLFVLAGAGRQESKREGEAPAGDTGKNEETKGDPAKGKQIFADNCLMCHNPESEEVTVGPGLKGLFAKPPHKMADGTEHAKHTVPMIREQIVNGSSVMPAAGSALSNKELDDLIAYLQTL